LEETITVAGFDIVLGPSFFIMMVIVFLAGIIRGFTGFGSALLIVPALAMLYGPAQAVVIEVLIEIPVSLGLLPLALREAERKTVLPMLGMFVLFVPFGTLLLTLVNPDYVKVFISLFVLVSVGLMSQQLRIANLFSPKANFLVGAVSGTTQGLTGMAGPLFATALIARGEKSSLTRANISALAGGIIGLSVLSFWAFDLITAQTIFYATLASPAILFGVWVGSFLFRRLYHKNLRGIILWFLAFMALAILYQTLS
jgi:uncharacterized membrane protein YfcA